jgi:predicted GNAT family acetyltransferase
MADDDIQVRDNAAQSRYEASVAGRLAGVLTYTVREDTAELLHTEVGDEFQGRGVAEDLVRQALDDARARGRRVVPTCPYVGRFLDKHPEYRDLAS